MSNRNARFAHGRDLAALRSPPYGLFLGYHGLPRRPLLSDAPGHALVVAPTRAGKGVGLLMQNALAWPGSLIVLDPKGEFREKTLHWRSQYQTCFTWGPTTFASRWNPLAEIADRDPDDQMEEAMRLARAFGSSGGTASSGNDTFWANQGMSMLASAFLWAATCQPDSPATLAHVHDLLSRSEDLDLVVDTLLDSPNDTLATWAAGVKGETPTLRANARSTALSYLRSFASGPVRDATAAADLSYAKLLEPGTTLYLHASATDFTTHGALLVAFLEGFINRALGATGALAEPLLLLLDEFSLLPALPSLRTLLTLSAGYNLRLLVVLQNLAQVQPETRDILLANTYDQVFFAARDPATTEHLAKRIGTTHRRTVTRSHGRSGTSRSVGERKDDLLAPHQIRDMKRALLFHGNAPPARITLRPYYKDKRFAARLGDVLPPTPAPHALPALDQLLPMAEPFRAPADDRPHADELDAQLDDLEAIIDDDPTD